MKFDSMLAFLSIVSVLAVSAAPAWASPGPVGEWRIADGDAIVAIRPCGNDLCGYVASDMKQDLLLGNRFSTCGLTAKNGPEPLSMSPAASAIPDISR